MLTIGLTGGIGSGKTMVSDLFRAQGVCIIDTDLIAREVVALNTPCLAKIVEHFGDTILTPDGHLNRRLLREIIFQEPAEKKWLENLLHPAIREEVQKQITRCEGPYCLVVIPLLAESGGTGYEFLDHIVVVDCLEEIQLERAMQRDGLTREQALAMLNAQAPRLHRLNMADHIIDNTRDLLHLKKQVSDLHQQFLVKVK